MSARCLIDCVGPVDLTVSRWPKYVYALTLVPVLAAVLISGLGVASKLVITLLALIILFWEWRRRPQVDEVTFAPRQLRCRLADGRVVELDAPFRCMVTTQFVSVRASGISGGWLTLFADQFDSEHFRQLRRVLWLGRR